MLRVEDIDTPRVVLGSAERIAEDLVWLGLDTDEGPPPFVEPERGDHAPYTQSARSDRYIRALEHLEREGLVYRCDCSRAEIARAASAPHAGEELVYPGTCRELPQDRAFKRPPALRLRVPAAETIAFDDLCRGRNEERVAAAAGDFVLRRGDGIFAYQLAVALDDAEMRIDVVVRADDLLASTARQLLLARLLGYAEGPRYAHVPLVVGADGARLAKRARGATVRDLRARGLSPESVLGTLAHGLGLAEAPVPTTARAIAAGLAPDLHTLGTWRREPWPIPAAWT